MRIPIGTKSILFGAHQFAIHPWFVALAWWKLYGFPIDPRLWVAFFVHDLGYWGKPNMDGEEGERHVDFGADFMHRLFDWRTEYWYWWMVCHSRYIAKRVGEEPSQLCFADKLAFVITPAWIYIPLVWLTGEWREYAKVHQAEIHYDCAPTIREWHLRSRAYVLGWVNKHKDGVVDTWTIDRRASA